MTVNRIDSDVVYQIDAEVNIVVGMNRDIYLCYRYIDNGEDYDFNIDYDTYYYMVVNDYKAASLFELKEKIIDGQSVKFDLLASYYKNTWDHYCPSYLFEEADLEKLVAELKADLKEKNGLVSDWKKRALAAQTAVMQAYMIALRERWNAAEDIKPPMGVLVWCQSYGGVQKAAFFVEGETWYTEDHKKMHVEWWQYLPLQK
jgi:hypothetical protein